MDVDFVDLMIFFLGNRKKFPFFWFLISFFFLLCWWSLNQWTTTSVLPLYTSVLILSATNSIFFFDEWNMFVVFFHDNDDYWVVFFTATVDFFKFRLEWNNYTYEWPQATPFSRGFFLHKKCRHWLANYY